MTTEQPQEPQKPPRQEIHISFEPAPPKPKKQRRWADLGIITVACGAIGAVFHSSAVFGITFFVCLALYAIGGPGKSKQT